MIGFCIFTKDIYQFFREILQFYLHFERTHGVCTVIPAVNTTVRAVRKIRFPVLKCPAVGFSTLILLSKILITMLC